MSSIKRVIDSELSIRHGKFLEKPDKVIIDSYTFREYIT